MYVLRFKDHVELTNFDRETKKWILINAGGYYVRYETEPGMRNHTAKLYEAKIYNTLEEAQKNVWAQSCDIIQVAIRIEERN